MALLVIINKSMSKSIETEISTKQEYDVIYSASHAFKLCKDYKEKEIKAYVKSFFFMFGCKVFYKNGNEYELMSLVDVKKLIAKDLKIYEGKNEVFNAQTFLDGSEFKEISYVPIIDFTKARTFQGTEIVDGINTYNPSTPPGGGKTSFFSAGGFIPGAFQGISGIPPGKLTPFWSGGAVPKAWCVCPGAGRRVSAAGDHFSCFAESCWKPVPCPVRAKTAWV